MNPEKRADRSSAGRLLRLALGLVAPALTTLGCATTTDRLGLGPLRTVSEVDLTRYAGTWYEIANYPQHFQRGCTATTATYTLKGDGEVEVVNRCRKETLQGEEKSAKGRARLIDPDHSAKLEVSFFWPFWGAYWVIDLGADYEYAVVGHPSRDYLWILSRMPQMSDTTYKGILQRLKEQGYPLDRIQRTLQPPPAAAPATGRAGG